MSYRLSVAAFVAGAVLTMAAPLGAQVATSDDGARQVTLQEAIDLAMRNAPAAVQAAGLDRNANAGRRQAKFAYVPTVNLTAGTGRTQGTTINNFNGQLTSLSGNPWSYNNGLGLNLELFDGGRRYSEINRLRATSVVAEATSASCSELRVSSPRHVWNVIGTVMRADPRASAANA